MSDDVKALIAEAHGWETPAVVAQHAVSAHDTIRRLTAALEATQQAPRTSVQEVLELLDAFHGDNRMSYDAYADLHNAVALLDVQQAPAVDREALIRAIRVPTKWHSNDAGLWEAEEWILDEEDAGEVADHIFQSGVLQDASVLAREVEARGLEKAAMLCDDKWGEFAYIDSQGVIGYATVPEILNEAAQQVREGKA